jgi:uncharacterized membrane protein
MNTTDSTVTPPAVIPEDKTVAIVSYLTLIGFIVAVVLHGSKKTRLGAFHLRQSLGLMIASVALMIVSMVFAIVPIIGWLFSMCAWLALFVLWVLGLVAAANGEQKPVPLIGEHMQKWFGTAFD